MGTQQLLFLILVAIIVAVAISLAIIYFKSNQQETEINEVINELNHVSVTAQGWYRKPTQMGGGNGSFDGFTFMSISQPDSTDLAKYQIVSTGGNLLKLEAVGHLNFSLSVSVYPDSIGSYGVVRW
ncbi:MAG TPA: hypothetical protein VIS48_02360 [Candidatus Kryptonia bacterium]